MLSGCTLINMYSVGYCIGRGFFADKTLSFAKKRFYTRSFLLQHPTKGLILVDTGYGEALVALMRQGMYRLYNYLLPFEFEPKQSVVAQLAADGIFLRDLSYLMITHFHPDHIGALPEFATVPWIYRADSLEMLRSLPFANSIMKYTKRKLPSQAVKDLYHCVNLK